MGILDGLFGPKLDPLPEGDDALFALERQGAALESFVAGANDSIELVPGDSAVYAFIGKPPKAFGIVWFEGATMYDVRSSLESKALTREAAARLVGELGSVYSANAGNGRYAHAIRGHRVTVATSPEFFKAVDAAMRRALQQTEA